MPLYTPPPVLRGDIQGGGDSRDQNFLGWTFDPAQGVTGTALTTGRQYFHKVWVPRTVTFSNVWFHVSVIGATLTAGANNLALYNSAGTQIAATVDQTTNYTTTLLKTVAFTTPVLVQGGPGVFVWVGFKGSGTTPPTIIRLAGVAQMQNAGPTAATARVAINGTNAATLMPASITPSSNDITTQGAHFWMGLT